MKKRLKWTLITVVLAVLVVAVGGIGLTRQNQSVVTNVAVAPQQGYRMPSFTLKEYPDNKMVSTSALTGKPIFINFWTSWCTYCKLESPDLVKAYKKYGRKVVFLSVNDTKEDSMSDMIAFVKQYGMTWPIALDTTERVSREYKIIGFPSSFFVTRQGIIDNVTVGAITAANLNAELQRISQ